MMKKTRLLPTLLQTAFVIITAGSIGLSAEMNVINGSSENDQPQLNFCLLPIKDACFWKSTEFHVMENRNAVILGHPGPNDTCKRGLKYHLLNGTGLVTLQWKDKSKWLLISRPYLDREEEEIDKNVFSLSCSDGYENSVQSFSLKILDENDNPPVKLQNWYDGSSLLAMDLDTRKVNKYSAILPDIYSDIFNINLILKELHLSDIVATGIYCDATIKGTSKASESEYYFTLLVNDTTLLPQYGPSEIEVPVKLRIFKPNTVFCERDVGLPRLNQKATIQYTKEPIILSSSAAPFSRITQPTNTSSLKGYEFSLNFTEEHTATFNITQTEGIVYLQDTSLLNHPFNSSELEVFWTDENGQKGSAKLKIILEDKVLCDSQSHLHAWATCAESITRKNCTNTCGLGTGTISRVSASGGVPGGCRWLEPVKRKGYTRNYSTCVPDPETCPDGRCDPLEELHERLCPQDCSSYIMAPAFSGIHGRGIKVGIGICSCDPYGTCSCYPNIQGKLQPKNNTRKYSTTLAPSWESRNHTPPNRGPECGAACLTGVVSGSLLVTATVAMLFIICRTRWLTKKTGQRNRKLSASQVPIHSTDTLLTIDPGQTPTDHNLEATMVDPKWEFPRDRLEIESCLGEGEFGRVLRAKAHNIAGVPGITTVAVKTLKDSAGPAELADLMSEYQMLKEISHPNVIRLLGASTSPGGPVYLIMEFAHHGSLKSYLRRHRRLEVRQEQESEPQIEEVTPQDILSFSWQISKGMEYLSDMKLVHRDLAARNILVASGKICKVSDFGLTRDIYEDDTYLKRSKGRVPVKWMALESLADHVYTSKSDIWSFGILLWELVTLGSSPYPGVAVHNLFYLLRAGYRMEKPENCSHQLYDIMRSCWQEDPLERPSFKQLTRAFELMLEDGTDYLDLSARFVYNRTYFTDIPQQDVTMNMDSSSDNEEPVTIVENKDEEKISNLVALNKHNIIAHYVNEKVTLEGYESPKLNFNKQKTNMNYANMPQKNE
ncbi:protein kinase receptor Ret oncogene [Lycorma delicatula]|uniref:protein kinase receptor Ret oncogene n=1 Tax=Lycorma delicatula TaxID=130591 RepID=UPI003F51331D